MHFHIRYVGLFWKGLALGPSAPLKEFSQACLSLLGGIHGKLCISNSRGILCAHLRALHLCGAGECRSEVSLSAPCRRNRLSSKSVLGAPISHLAPGSARKLQKRPIFLEVAADVAAVLAGV